MIDWSVVNRVFDQTVSNLTDNMKRTQYQMMVIDVYSVIIHYIKRRITTKEKTMDGGRCRVDVLSSRCHAKKRSQPTTAHKITSKWGHQLWRPSLATLLW